MLEAMYVPSKLVDIEEGIPGMDLQGLINILVGGELLLAVRARGAIYIWNIG